MDVPFCMLVATRMAISNIFAKQYPLVPGRCRRRWRGVSTKRENIFPFQHKVKKYATILFKISTITLVKEASFNKGRKSPQVQTIWRAARPKQTPTLIVASMSPTTLSRVIAIAANQDMTACTSNHQAVTTSTSTLTRYQSLPKPNLI